MCYTCGCREPDEDHGDSRNLTNADFEAAAEAMDISAEEARRNTQELLGSVDASTGQA